MCAVSAPLGRPFSLRLAHHAPLLRLSLSRKCCLFSAAATASSDLALQQENAARTTWFKRTTIPKVACCTTPGPQCDVTTLGVCSSRGWCVRTAALMAYSTSWNTPASPNSRIVLRMYSYIHCPKYTKGTYQHESFTEPPFCPFPPPTA